MDGQPLSQITTIQSDDLIVTVADLGAEMQSLGTADGTEFLWHGDPEWWSGRSPILFPIVGRAPGDRVEIDGQGGDMPQHGFARRMVFERIRAEPNRVIHSLVDSMATQYSFPRPFALTVGHSVKDRTLSVTATVSNTGRSVLPFGLGFHPAFRWPLPDADGQAHHIRLHNGAEPALARLEGGLLRPDLRPSPFRQGKLTLDPGFFDEDAMIFPEGAGDALTYRADSGPKLEFRFNGFPNLGLWQKPGAPFICIEPWHGMAAQEGAGPEIGDRPFTKFLAAGEIARFSWSVTIS